MRLVALPLLYNDILGLDNHCPILRIIEIKCQLLILS